MRWLLWRSAVAERHGDRFGVVILVVACQQGLKQAAELLPGSKRRGLGLISIEAPSESLTAGHQRMDHEADQCSRDHDRGLGQLLEAPENRDRDKR